MAKTQRERGADGDPASDAPVAAVRRRRERIEGAVVAQELAATMTGPHMGVSASATAVPGGRPAIVCDRCNGVIDTPGVAIMRGRMVMHVRCDLRASA